MVTSWSDKFCFVCNNFAIQCLQVLQKYLEYRSKAWVFCLCFPHCLLSSNCCVFTLASLESFWNNTVPTAAVIYKQFPVVWVNICEFQVMLADILEAHYWVTSCGQLAVHDIFWYITNLHLTITINNDRGRDACWGNWFAPVVLVNISLCDTKVIS